MKSKYNRHPIKEYLLIFWDACYLDPQLIRLYSNGDAN